MIATSLGVSRGNAIIPGMKRWLGCLVLLPALALAKPWWMQGSQAREGDFLPPDEAFRVTARVDGALLRVHWDIADGYYLYRSKFDIMAQSPGLSVEPAVFPPGIPRTDAWFGSQEIFQHDVEALVGFRRTDGGAHPLQIRVAYQGCAEAGLCYPLLIKVLGPDARAMPMASPAITPAHLPARSPAAAAPAATRAHGSTAWPAGITLAGVLLFFLSGMALRRIRPDTSL